MDKKNFSNTNDEMRYIQIKTANKLTNIYS